MCNCSSNLKINSERRVDIKFKEGFLSIEIDKDENIFMTGPVSKVKIMAEV